MTYSIKEIFYTLQGEGANTGSSAVFCRFAGCNLWSGLERDRPNAVCQFCDTDFVGTNGTHGGKYESTESLAGKIEELWPRGSEWQRFVVLTGGEPALQLDSVLIDELHARNFRIALETNGTLKPPVGIDWVCVSPKSGAPLTVSRGHELKVVWPQAGLNLNELETLDFEHFFLQPMDGPKQSDNIKVCIDTCLGRPKWRLSLQSHKIIGIR